MKVRKDSVKGFAEESSEENLIGIGDDEKI
jgi:hypothetical protein